MYAFPPPTAALGLNDPHARSHRRPSSGSENESKTSHGHSHDHVHDHSHSHDNSHDHSHSENDTHRQKTHGHPHSHADEHSHDAHHDHSHKQENGNTHDSEYDFLNDFNHDHSHDSHHDHSHNNEHEHSHKSHHDHSHSKPNEHSHESHHDHSHGQSNGQSIYGCEDSSRHHHIPAPQVQKHNYPTYSYHTGKDSCSSIKEEFDITSHSRSHSHAIPIGTHASHLHQHSHSQPSAYHDEPILHTSPKKTRITLYTISTPLLISLTYLITEYSSQHHHITHSSDAPLQEPASTRRRPETSANLLSACSLVAGTLLLSSLFSKFKYFQQQNADNSPNGPGKSVPERSKHRERISVQNVAERALSMLLPYYAALELGGVKTGLFTLAALAGGVYGALRSSGGLSRLLGAQKGITGALAAWVVWEAVTAAEGEFHAIMIAYIALGSATLFLQSPFDGSATAFTSTKATAQEHNRRYALSLVTGGICLAPPILKWLFIEASMEPDPRGAVLASSPFFWWWILGVLAGWVGLTFANIGRASVGVEGHVGFVAGAVGAILGDVVLNVRGQTLWSLVDKSIFVACVVGANHYDHITAQSHAHDDHHGHDHDHGHGHSHGGDHHDAPVSTKSQPPSRISLLLISLSQPAPLLHSILIDRNSRRIFYFMMLNFTFMIIQTVYGILTSSLGLLSDSIHMLFDCLALLLGLFAAVMSKYPPSTRFPYGLGKMDTLAGFANGIFLMLISVEIVVEAIERLVKPVEMQRIGELLFVSSGGLAVNLVGIWAFDHAHHHPGHSHGHSHSHSHGGGGDDHHGEGSDNMHGIFLHILADTLGSVAVVISTLLIQQFGWQGFDPLASVFIAVMIFISAIPLVISAAKGLLLTVPNSTEYALRDVLAGVGGIRGVVGCCVPRFWTDVVAEGEGEEGSNNRTKILGALHVQVSRDVLDLAEVRESVERYLLDGLGKGGVGVDVVIQVERMGDGSGECWCGGGGNTENIRYRGSIANGSGSHGSVSGMGLGLGGYGLGIGASQEERSKHG